MLTWKMEKQMMIKRRKEKRWWRKREEFFFVYFHICELEVLCFCFKSTPLKNNWKEQKNLHVTIIYLSWSSATGSILMIRGFWISRAGSAEMGSCGEVMISSISALSASALSKEALATLVMHAISNATNKPSTRGSN